MTPLTSLRAFNINSVRCQVLLNSYREDMTAVGHPIKLICFIIRNTLKNLKRNDFCE